MTKNELLTAKQLLDKFAVMQIDFNLRWQKIESLVRLTANQLERFACALEAQKRKIDFIVNKLKPPEPVKPPTLTQAQELAAKILGGDCDSNFLNEKIENVFFDDKRILNCLWGDGLRTIEDVANCPHLKQITNFGPLSYCRVKDRLAEHGISLTS